MDADADADTCALASISERSPSTPCHQNIATWITLIFSLTREPREMMSAFVLWRCVEVESQIR